MRPLTFTASVVAGDLPGKVAAELAAAKKAGLADEIAALTAADAAVAAVIAVVLPSARLAGTDSAGAAPPGSGFSSNAAPCRSPISWARVSVTRPVNRPEALVPATATEATTGATAKGSAFELSQSRSA